MQPRPLETFKQNKAYLMIKLAGSPYEKSRGQSFLILLNSLEWSAPARLIRWSKLTDRKNAIRAQYGAGKILTGCF